MTQYCRYCSNMICGDANYCYVRQRTYSDKYIKHTNRCKDFDLNPVDALGENSNEYRPRPAKTRVDPRQITIGELLNGTD